MKNLILAVRLLLLGLLIHFAFESYLLFRLYGIAFLIQWEFILLMILSGPHLWLIVMIERGKYWARIVLLVVFVISCWFVVPLLQDFPVSDLVPYFVELVLRGIALGILFFSSAEDCFKKSL